MSVEFLKNSIISHIQLVILLFTENKKNSVTVCILLHIAYCAQLSMVFDAYVTIKV